MVRELHATLAAHGPDGDARFEFGIDVLLAGFEAASERELSGPVGR